MSHISLDTIGEILLYCVISYLLGMLVDAAMFCGSLAALISLFWCLMYNNTVVCECQSDLGNSVRLLNDDYVDLKIRADLKRCRR